MSQSFSENFLDQIKGKLWNFSSVQSLSCVRLFATPWIAARQASLSITNSRLLKLMSTESVMPSSHLILLSPSPPAPNPSQHQGLFQWVNSAWGGQSIGVSASASILPMNTQDWSPLGWTGWISLQSKGFREPPKFKALEEIPFIDTLFQNHRKRDLKSN